MTWIKTAQWKENQAIREMIESAFLGIYPKEYLSSLDMFKEYEAEGEPAAVVMAQTLIPEALKHALLAYGSLLSPDLPLTRREHELIAAAVSSLNKTHYCRNYHAFFLKLATNDDELANSVRDDYRTANLTPKERAMIDYAAKVTLSPSCIEEGDIEELRKNGFDDQAILQINLIAAQFNYWNRVADGLGVGRSKQKIGLKEPSLTATK